MFNFFTKKKNDVVIKAPINGKIVAIENVPDKVFSAKLMGNGIGIDITSNTLYAPCDAKVMLVAATKHAIGLQLANGAEILIHVGLDTVNFKGEGFTCYVEANQKVKAGDKLLEIDRDFFIANNTSLVTPIVVTNGNDFPIKQLTSETEAIANQTNLITL